MFKKPRSRSVELARLCLPRLIRDKRSSSVDSSAGQSPSHQHQHQQPRSSSLDIDRFHDVSRTLCDVSTSSRDVQGMPDISTDLLQVPAKGGRRAEGGGGGRGGEGCGHRSHSFDTTSPWSLASSDDNSSDRETCGGQQGRRASLDIPPLCMHCLHLQTRPQPQDKAAPTPTPTFYLGDDSRSSSDSDSDHQSVSPSRSGISDTEQGPNPGPSPRSGQASPSSDSPTPPPAWSYRDVVTLTVPAMKPRSSSVDSGCVSKPPPESPRKASLDERVLHKATTAIGQGAVAAPRAGKEPCLTWLASLQLTFK